MPDSKVTDLTAAAAALTSHELYVNEAGADKKLTILQIEALFGNVLRNQSTADQACSANATTYITGSQIVVPAGLIRVGTTFRWTCSVSKTAAGTAAKSLLVKLGTAGTTADATWLTFALPAGTAVADTGGFELFMTVRALNALAGNAVGQLCFWHNLATTGLATAQNPVVNATSAAVSDTVANLKVGLAFAAGVSEAWTFQQCLAEAKNL